MKRHQDEKALDEAIILKKKEDLAQILEEKQALQARFEGDSVLQDLLAQERELRAKIEKGKVEEQ